MMTHDEAIESLINTCNELKDIIEQLQEENAFLVDTIEKNNLGQTKSERRSLLVKNERYKKESQLAIEKANRIREEYESKMSEANSRLADARKKQSEIELYINNEAENKIAEIKSEYQKHKESIDKALEQRVIENEKQMQEYKIFLDKKRKKYLLIATAGVLVGFTGFIVNFI